MNRPLDDMEKIIADLGIELSAQTIIYNAEEADFDEDDSEDSFGTGGNSEIPDAVFALRSHREAGYIRSPRP